MNSTGQKSAWKMHEHECGALRMHTLECGLRRALGRAEIHQPTPYTAKQQELIEKLEALFSQKRWEVLNRMEVSEVLQVADELRFRKPTQPDAYRPAVGMLLMLARSLGSVNRQSEAIGLTEKTKAFASAVGDQVGLKESSRDFSTPRVAGTTTQSWYTTDHIITSFERAISLLHTHPSGSEKSTMECYLGDLLDHAGK